MKGCPGAEGELGLNAPSWMIPVIKTASFASKFALQTKAAQFTTCLNPLQKIIRLSTLHKVCTQEQKGIYY